MKAECKRFEEERSMKADHVAAGPDGRSRAPRASLSRPVILAAALALVEREGFEALTMRGVAGVLGSGAMALYRHFRDRDELVEALLDELLGTIPLILDDRDAWPTQLRQLARAHRALLLRVPSAIPYFLATPRSGPQAARFGEVLLGVLHRAGFSDEAAVGGFYTVLALNYGLASFEARRQGPGTPEDPMAERIRRTQVALALLPEREFPLTVALAGPLARFATTAAYYDFALDVVVRGMAEPGQRLATPQGEPAAAPAGAAGV
jgi:TetR/AcrR family tetracycline transcriptional repressor